MTAGGTGGGVPTESAPGPWLDSAEALTAFLAEVKEHAGWSAALEWPGCITWSHPEDGFVFATPDSDGEHGVVPVEIQDPDGHRLASTSFLLPGAPQYATIAERAAGYQRLITPHLDTASALVRSERSRSWAIEVVPSSTTGTSGGLYLHLDATGMADVRALYMSVDLAVERTVREAIARHGIGAFAAIAASPCPRDHLAELLRPGG